MAEERVNGPEDSIVTDDKAASTGRQLRNYKARPRPLKGSARTIQLLAYCKIGVSAETRCRAPKKELDVTGQWR